MNSRSERQPAGCQNSFDTSAIAAVRRTGNGSRAIVLLLATVFLSPHAAAQNGPDNDPDAAPGYVDNVFHHKDFDSINLYNGGLTIPIALGPDYPVGPKLKFQMMLTYGSHFTGFGKPHFLTSNFQFTPLIGDPAIGIGWTLTMGSIKYCKVGGSEGKCYFAPDGSQHFFALIAGQSAQSSDGTQLLLHDMGASGYEMWDGDGNRYVFGWQVSGYDDSLTDPNQSNLWYIHDFGHDRDGWYLTQVSDPFSNTYTVEYQDDPDHAAPSKPCWSYLAGDTCTRTRMVCTGTHSWIPWRIITPTLSTTNYVQITVDANGMISTVAFPGPSSATWTFNYDSSEQFNIPCDKPGTQVVFSHVFARRLVSLDLPGSSTGAYGFTYWHDSSNSFADGLLRQITLPTQATIEYCYQAYSFHHGRVGQTQPGCNSVEPQDIEIRITPAIGCNVIQAPEPPAALGSADCTPTNPATWIDSQMGVVKRTETVGTNTWTTHYTQYAFPWGERGGNGTGLTKYPSQTLTVVTYPPDNDLTQHSKAVLFHASSLNHTNHPVPGDRIGADVEERDFIGAPPTPSAVTQPACGGAPEATFCGTQAVRVTTRAYEYQLPSLETFSRHLQSETICYGPTILSGTCSRAYRKNQSLPTNNYAGWEANGRHYDTEEHRDKFGTSEVLRRSITTTWTPQQWQATPPTGPVLPNLFSAKVTTEGAYTRSEKFEFVPSNGFLRGRSIFEPDPSFNGPWLHCWFPDSNGNPVNDFTATYPGLGDPATNACSAAYRTWSDVIAGSPFGNSDAFGREKTFAQGQLLSSKWWDSIPQTSGGPIQGPLAWFAARYDRDPTTGWVTASYDTAGKKTSYGYDSLGRVTSVTPQSPETLISIAYPSTTQTTVTRGSLTWEQYNYDSLGRLTREIRQTGASAYAVRTHRFDGTGREDLTSEWGTCTSVAPSGDCYQNQPGGTTSSGFDPAGRPARIVGPSNGTYTEIDRTDSTALYSDTKETVKTCINGVWNGSACSAGLTQTQRFMDLFGRVTTVIEPTTDQTTYTYDVNDKLRSVTQGANPRTFTYNSFGYLTKEVTPEKGGSASPVDYLSYGSIGNVRQRREGTGSEQRTHDYTYDGAGRLVIDKVGSTQYLLNCYDGDNTVATATCKDGATPNFYGGAGSAFGGKVTRRVGNNPLFTPLFPSTAASERIQEDFTYAGSGGRISAKTTTILGNTGLTIGAVSGALESWGYNSLGLVATHGHPRVRGSLLETMSYSFGRLSSMALSGTDFDNTPAPGVTITPTFRAAGNLGSYTSGLSAPGSPTLVSIIYQDFSLIPRPRQIQANKAGVPTFLFDTGNMSYDAAGNITNVGTDSFVYDSLSRVTSANYGTVQTYTYDRYGNLMTKGGTIFCTTQNPCTNNKIPAAFGASYDSRGNLTGFSGESLTYDDSNRQTKEFKASVTWQYLLNGGDERLVRVPTNAPTAVPRREIARYIVQGKPFTPFAGTCTEGTPFADVHCNDPDWSYIYAISMQPGQAGLTSGCGGGNYCPDSSTTRAQAAVFLMRAEHGRFYSPTCNALYVDAPCSDPTSAFMEAAVAESVLAICSPNHVCPGSSLTELDAVTGMADNNLWPTYKPVAGGSLYTLRDNDNHVVTEFADSLPQRDNVFIGNIVVASYLPKMPGGTGGSWQFHTSDHLGTIRLTVDAATIGSQFLEASKYWPYGDRFTPVPTPNQRIAFAAMERDFESNHFYDHARHHDFNLARFVNPDKIGGHAINPQSWNRYSYSVGNPLKYVDPNGLEPVYVISTFPEGQPHPRIEASVIQNLNQAGAVYMKYGEYNQETLADIFSNPENDVVLVGHSLDGGADFLTDPIMLGRPEAQLLTSGLGNAAGSRSFSLVGCSTANVCSPASMQKIPGAVVGGKAAGDAADPGINRLSVFSERLGRLLAAGVPLAQAIKAAEKAANTDSRLKKGEPTITVRPRCSNGSSSDQPCS